MIHPPYSLGLTPIDYYLFVLRKKHLAGKQFATDTGLKQAVISWLLTLDNDFFYVWTWSFM